MSVWVAVPSRSDAAASGQVRSSSGGERLEPLLGATLGSVSAQAPRIFDQDSGPVALGQQVGDISLLVTVTAVHQCVLAEHVLDRAPEGFGRQARVTSGDAACLTISCRTIRVQAKRCMKGPPVAVAEHPPVLPGLVELAEVLLGDASAPRRYRPGASPDSPVARLPRGDALGRAGVVGVDRRQSTTGRSDYPRGRVRPAPCRGTIEAGAFPSSGARHGVGHRGRERRAASTGCRPVAGLSFRRRTVTRTASRVRSTSVPGAR